MNNYILEIKKLKKCFPEICAVNGISFNIKRGTCFGLLGPNGAGKTTTIEMIEGIITPSAGKILFNSEKRKKNFHEKIGIQLQNTELPQFLTVKETLETFSRLYKKRTDINFLKKLCQLEEIWKRDNSKISGGQKQRLLLAMSLVNDPELIFLDEPTTGLDPQARRHLWEIVNQIKSENKTIILTTHYMEEAEILCDKIAIMDHGKIIAKGKTEELLENNCRGASIILNNKIDDSLLNKLPCKWYRINNQIKIQTSKLNECLTILLDKKVDLSGINIRKFNLDDLFLKLTGSKLRA